MNKYTASNGMTVERHRKYPTRGFGIYYANGLNSLNSAYDHLHDGEMQALREFFRAEEDERLGRWRWPENPDYVVYTDEDGDVIVLNESTGRRSEIWTRQSVARYPNSIPAKVAAAYFAAHPEPKPWHEAKPGEVWELTYGGQPTAHVFTDRWIGGHEERAFVSDRAIVLMNDQDITAGRRIWPED